MPKMNLPDDFSLFAPDPDPKMEELYEIDVEELLATEFETQAEFLLSEQDFQGTFDTWSEHRVFFLDLAEKYPNGLTYTKITQLMNEYIVEKATRGLVRMGLLNKVKMQDGSDGFVLASDEEFAKHNLPVPTRQMKPGA